MPGSDDRATVDDPRPPAGSLLTRLPGRACSTKVAMREFEDDIAKLRKRYKPAFWPLFIPKAEDMFRWRVQLECGCIYETYTRGKDDYPDEHPRTDPLTQERLPKGEFWCTTEHDLPHVYLEIVEWVSSEVKEFPPDPEEPRYEGIDAGTWAIVRRTEPHSSAFWKVRLACGHFYEHVVTGPEWKPEDGPRYVPAERVAEVRAEYEEHWAEKGPAGWPEEAPRREHTVRMLDLGLPRPEPEQDCYACRHARQMTGYQRVGWLVPRTKPKPQPTEREKAEAQLARAEAEVARLRKQLGKQNT